MTSHYIPQGYRINARQTDNFFNMGNWEIQKKMAMAKRSNPDPDLPSNYRIEGNRKIYLSPESERIANLRLASGQGFRTAIGKQDINYVDIAPKERNNNYNINNNAKGMGDAAQPLMFKIATRGLDPMMAQNNITTQQDLNESADQQMARYIAENLKANELSTGQEFTAQELEQIIKNRFANVNDNIVKLAIDLIINDVEDVKSRVAGNSFNDFKLLVSARKPKTVRKQK